jgi:hypothetical protein
MNVEIVEFKTFARNTLLGFLSIRIVELDLEINDLTVHAREEKRWVGLPGRPQIDREGKAITKDGKIQYAPVLKFASRQASDAFNTAVLQALDRHRRSAA